MSGRSHHPWDMIEDLIMGRLLDPKEAADLTPAQLEVIAAHIRSEILFSPDIHKFLGEKAKQVLQELQ